LNETGVTFDEEPWMRFKDFPDPIPFPEKGSKEKSVLNAVKELLSKDFPTEKNFEVLGLDAHPFSKKVFTMALPTIQAGFLKDVYPGTYRASLESVRMVGSLLNAKNPFGYITTGGFESNIAAVRLARNLAKKNKPELVMVESGHYSFPLAGELFGVKVKVAETNLDGTPNMDQVEKLINRNTTMLICSAPDWALGLVEPVKQFGELAEKKGLYLHVDSAIGGFFLPFLPDLGYKVPMFDFRIPAVSSITADAHKLGLQQRPTSAFIIRDREFVDSIPVEKIYSPYLSGSGRMGASAVSLWALLKYLGKNGYRKYVKNAMEQKEMMEKRIAEIDGLKLAVRSDISQVNLASSGFDITKVNQKLRSKGWFANTVAMPHTKTIYIRIFIHPLKKKENTARFLDDLEWAAKAAKKA
jgi:tyrosine decarboxylase / aspartate 1-decarboxylase